MRSAVRASSVLVALTLVMASCGDDDDAAESTSVPDDGAGSTTEVASATDVESTSDVESTAAAPDDTSGSSEVPGESACEATVSGSRVNYGQFAPVQLLDPIGTSGGLAGGTELAGIYDVLISFDHETAEYVPKLAESIESNEDFTVWTLGLREGIEFSDGTPLDADAVVASMARYSQAEDVRDPSASLLEMIDEMTVVDELTVEFQLATPWSEFPHVLSRGPGMIVNANAIDDPAAFGAQPPDAAGVGPFVVERNVPGEETVMRAREDYWDGTVCLETLRFVFIPGAQATYDAYEAGELDVAFMRADNVIQTALDNGEDGFIFHQASGGAIILNHRDDRPAADPRVREAMVLAIDPDTINDRAQQGALTVGKGLMQEGTLFYSEDLEEPATDPDRARTLLEEAKADGYDGRIALSCTASPPGPETALTVEGMLEAVGFEVDAQSLPVNEQIGQVIGGDFDAACWGVNFDASSVGTALLRNFHSQSPANRVGYENPEMDDALLRYLAAPDTEAREEVLAEISTIYTEDVVAISYGATREGVVVKPEVQGVLPTSNSVFLFDQAHIAE